MTNYTEGVQIEHTWFKPGKFYRNNLKFCWLRPDLIRVYTEHLIVFPTGSLFMVCKVQTMPPVEGFMPSDNFQAQVICADTVGWLFSGSMNSLDLLQKWFPEVVEDD